VLFPPIIGIPNKKSWAHEVIQWWRIELWTEHLPIGIHIHIPEWNFWHCVLSICAHAIWSQRISLGGSRLEADNNWIDFIAPGKLCADRTLVQWMGIMSRVQDTHNKKRLCVDAKQFHFVCPEKAPKSPAIVVRLFIKLLVQKGWDIYSSGGGQNPDPPLLIVKLTINLGHARESRLRMCNSRADIFHEHSTTHSHIYFRHRQRIRTRRQGFGEKYFINWIVLHCCRPKSPALISHCLTNQIKSIQYEFSRADMCAHICFCVSLWFITRLEC